MADEPSEGNPPVVVATRNEHKLRELAELLPELELELLPEGIELPPEEGDSFSANALVKAHARRARGDRPAGDRRRQRHRSRGAQRRPRDSLGPLRGRRRQR